MSKPKSPSSQDALPEQVTAVQEQIQHLRDQLTESQRLATIGTIAAVIAHEFNNLLTPIVSYSQYALASAKGADPDMELIIKALTKSAQSSEKAGKICRSMLALARGESSQARVSVQSLIDEALTVMARDPQKDGLALRVQVPAELAVQCDPVQLEQVLLNLMINARQAMAGRPGTLTVKAAAAGAEVRIAVTDTGPGIPAEHLPRIFQPFFTTKATARKGEPKGTGLGLTICKEIIERHQGRIDVISAVGHGTTFTIHLPL